VSKTVRVGSSVYPLPRDVTKTLEIPPEGFVVMEIAAPVPTPEIFTTGET
jgi:hypothetical protein